MNKELIDYLKAYQEWRRGADTEQPDPTELGEKLDIAIELLGISKLRESRESHPLTTKEEAEKQVAEFDKVQPINKGSSERIIHKGGENPADCHLCNTKDLDKVEDLLSSMEDIAHGDLAKKLAYAKKHLSDAYKPQLHSGEEWEEFYDIIDTIVDERDALLSENERLNNIIIELDSIIDLNEQQPCAEERDKYKKALKDLREWAEQEEHTWSLGKEMDCFVATHYYMMLEEIDKTLKETYKIEIGGETIDFPKD